jgi:hypothetical protein
MILRFRRLRENFGSHGGDHVFNSTQQNGK